MRMTIATAASLALVLALGACQVSKDDNNGTTSMTYNSDLAQNAAADVGNTAGNIAADIGNDVKATGAKIDNKVGNAKHGDKDGNSASNAAENK